MTSAILYLAIYSTSYRLVTHYFFPHVLSPTRSHFNSEIMEKSDIKSLNFHDSKTFHFTDNVAVGSNNVSDTDSSGGYTMGDKAVHSTRIDDQLEARIGLAESNSESTDIRLFIGSKTALTTPVACCPAAAPMAGPNFGPFGGPSFGPFEGPIFGFKAVADRWSELGTQTQILNPSLRGTEYSTPVGLQFYSPLWSQMEYQTHPCVPCSQVESDRWSGRWHGTGSTGTGSCSGAKAQAAG